MSCSEQTPTPIVLTTGHEIADTIGRAFAAGAHALTLPADRWNADAAAIPVFYGILRGTGDVAKACIAAGRPFIYIDKGYVGAEHFRGMYRIVLSALHWSPARLPAARSAWIPQWFNGWRHVERGVVVIAEPNRHSAAWWGIEPQTWVDEVCAELAKHTKRAKVITRKGDGMGISAVKHAHALITHSSNLAVDALIAGVPSFVLGEHPLAALGNAGSAALANIDNPRYADKREVGAVCARLASAQWTLDEMRDGRAWVWVKGLLNQ